MTDCGRPRWAIISGAAPFAIRRERASTSWRARRCWIACFGATRHMRTCQRLREGAPTARRKASRFRRAPGGSAVTNSKFASLAARRGAKLRIRSGKPEDSKLHGRMFPGKFSRRGLAARAWGGNFENATSMVGNGAGCGQVSAGGVPALVLGPAGGRSSCRKARHRKGAFLEARPRGGKNARNMGDGDASARADAPSPALGFPALTDRPNSLLHGPFEPGPRCDSNLRRGALWKRA